MNLEGARSAVREFSATASTILRNLGLAGIAAVWVLREDLAKGTTIPRGLRVAALCMVGALLLDLLQYVVASAVWATYARHREKHGTEPDDEFLAPAAINWPTVIFYFGKTLAMLVGYLFLLGYVRFTY